MFVDKSAFWNVTVFAVMVKMCCRVNCACVIKVAVQSKTRQMAVLLLPFKSSSDVRVKHLVIHHAAFFFFFYSCSSRLHLFFMSSTWSWCVIVVVCPLAQREEEPYRVTLAQPRWALMPSNSNAFSVCHRDDTTACDWPHRGSAVLTMSRKFPGSMMERLVLYGWVRTPNSSWVNA